jgi:hypothetical protein
MSSKSNGKMPDGIQPTLRMETKKPETDNEKKLRRRVEDRLRKDRDALILVARVLNME